MENKEEANRDPGTLTLQSPYSLEKKGMRYVIEKYLAKPEKAENEADRSHE